jgi:hypothetical protein
MSWIDKELRKREKQEARAQARMDSVQAGEGDAADGSRIQALWDLFEATNDALPEKLRLQREVSAGDGFPSERSMFLVMLNAKNGACLGYTGDAIRYLWPHKSARSSNNFWIRWQPGQGYRLSRRVKATALRPGTEERAFREPAVDHILRCLVIDKRVTFRSVRKRRFWLF